MKKQVIYTDSQKQRLDKLCKISDWASELHDPAINEELPNLFSDWDQIPENISYSELQRYLN